MQSTTEFFKKISEESPNEIMYPFNEIVELIGFENLYRFSELFGGTSIYVPKPRKMFKGAMDKIIRSEFNGGNYLALAKKYDLCERSIRNIIDSEN